MRKKNLKHKKNSCVSMHPGGWCAGILPFKRLMGMCRWIGSHFHDWIDYNGIAFSIVTKMGFHIFGFLGQESCSYLQLETYQNVCTTDEK